MVLMYPIIVLIFIVISILILRFNVKSKDKYNGGKKIANTKYVKETEYYQKKLREYKSISYAIKLLYIIGIILISILIARPVRIKTKFENKYNRDILLSIDLSGSQDEVNLELVRKFKAIIPNIEGDRIGIVIFNTAPIVYCPLTDDYEYINNCLNVIQEQLNKSLNYDYSKLEFDKDFYESEMLFYGGIIANYEVRGSSLIGDGLARNYIFIPRFKNK